MLEERLLPGADAGSEGDPSSRSRSSSVSLSADMLQRHASLASVGRKRSQTAYAQDFLRPVRGEKHVQAFWRWSMLWTLFFVLGLPWLPFYLLPLDCGAGQRFVMAMQLYGALVLLYVAIMCIRVMIKLRAAAKVRSWKDLYPTQDPRCAQLRHIVLMRGYKEPLELMFSTINSLRHQTVVEDLIVVVALEEGSPVHYDDAFYEEYQGVFADLVVTRHPRNWAPMERPGSCSNSNYAWRQIVQRLSNQGKLHRDSMICTSCDTDTVFPPHYFEYVGYAFLTHRKPHDVIWQSSLFYNLMLDQRPWFVRCTGLMRTAFMCAFLIGQSLNPMSTFSYSVDLLIRCDFIHPFHVMDDVVHIVTCMKALRGVVPVELVPIVLISGPTSGATWCEELYEWARQVRRWCIGTMAVYHYFVAKQLKGNFTLWAGLRYHFLFTHYYGFILCSVLFTSVTGEIALQVWRHTGTCTSHHHGYSDTLLQWVAIGSLLSSYLCFGVFFVLDKVGTSIAGIKEDISWWRNLLHWILSWPTLFMYNVVQVVSSLEGSLRGQAVITHNAAKKDNLAAVESDEVVPSKERGDKRAKTLAPTPVSNGGDVVPHSTPYPVENGV